MSASTFIKVRDSKGVTHYFAQNDLAKLAIDGTTIVEAQSGPKLGFYGVTPVTRAAHPVLLADVITLLTNLGLCQ